MPPLSVMIKYSAPCFSSSPAAAATLSKVGPMSPLPRRRESWISEETLKNVIRRTLLRAEGSISYAFQGGEPTLRGLDFFRKVMEYQKLYNRRGIRVSNAFQTNGYALDDDWCRFFAQHRFLVGLSVDGTKEIHDSLRRGRGDMGPTLPQEDGHIVLELAVVGHPPPPPVLMPQREQINQKPSIGLRRQGVGLLSPFLLQRIQALDVLLVSPSFFI